VKIGSRWVHLRTCQTCGVTLLVYMKDCVYIKDWLDHLHPSFGRILADSAGDLINLYSLNVTSPAAFVEFCWFKNDYALYEALETTLTR
jgi:hypothetical protein